MNEYEVLLMLDPELPEERASEIITRTRERVEQDGGTWDGHEPWGRRKLAYEIDHKTDGVYHLLLFSAGPETLAEVSRVLKIDDGVMRHLAVRRVKPTHDKTPAETKAPSEATAPEATAPAEATAPDEAEVPVEAAAVSEPADDASTAAE